MNVASADVLRAPHTMEFDYTRSTGPVVGAFLTGLRDRRVLGARDSAGRVVVPPPEYDAGTAAAIDAAALVEVASEGVVTSWSFNPTHRAGQPLEGPFHWVLVQLDGADTSILHAYHGVAVATGDRVRIRWAAETVGSIHDIACFESA